MVLISGTILAGALIVSGIGGALLSGGLADLFRPEVAEAEAEASMYMWIAISIIAIVIVITIIAFLFLRRK